MKDDSEVSNVKTWTDAMFLKGVGHICPNYFEQLS
jgi:hypothetical protein